MRHATLEQARVDAPKLNQHTILIVDDDPAVGDILSRRLKQQGFATTVADNAAEGLELARSRRPQAILLDVRLPDRDGLSVCEELVDDPATADIPVIIVSGMEQEDILRRSRAAGCRFYLRKPYDPNALLALLKQAIDENDE